MGWIIGIRFPAGAENLWGPPSLPSSGYQGLFSGGKVAIV